MDRALLKVNKIIRRSLEGCSSQGKASLLEAAQVGHCIGCLVDVRLLKILQELPELLVLLPELLVRVLQFMVVLGFLVATPGSRLPAPLPDMLRLLHELRRAAA